MSGQDGGIDERYGFLSHKPIKIITELMNNHHLEPPEVHLNWTPTTKGRKKIPY